VTSRLGALGLDFVVFSRIETNFFSGSHLSRLFNFGVLPEDGGNSSTPNDMIWKEGQSEKFCLRLLPCDIITDFKVQVIFVMLAEGLSLCHISGFVV
jgi:hypothetical protein